MTTESKIRQVIMWLLPSVGIAVVVSILIVEYARGSDLRKAIRWHEIHGDVILVDGHKLSVPKDWWEGDPSTDGKKVLVKASRKLLKTWQAGIIFDRKGPNEMKASEGEIRKTLEMFVRVENQGEPTPISSVLVVNAASTKIYCKKRIILEPMVELRCDVVGAPTLITSVGPPNTTKEIEEIIATFD